MLESLQKAKRHRIRMLSRSEDSVEDQLARMEAQQAMNKEAAKEKKRKVAIEQEKRNLHTSRSLRQVNAKTPKMFRKYGARKRSSNATTASDETINEALADFEGMAAEQMAEEDSGDDVDSSDEEEEDDASDDDLPDDDLPDDNWEPRALTTHAYGKSDVANAESGKLCTTANDAQPQNPEDTANDAQPQNPEDALTESDTDEVEDVEEYLLFLDKIKQEEDPVKKQQLWRSLRRECTYPRSYNVHEKLTGTQVHLLNGPVKDVDHLGPNIQYVWSVHVPKSYLEAEGIAHPAMLYTTHPSVHLVCFNDLSEETEEGLKRCIWCLVRPKQTTEAKLVTPGDKAEFPERYEHVHHHTRETGVVKVYVTPGSEFHTERNGVKEDRLDVLNPNADSKMLRFFEWKISEAKKFQTSKTKFPYKTGTIEISLQELYVPECVFRPLADDDKKSCEETEDGEEKGTCGDESKESKTDPYDELFWNKRFSERYWKRKFKTASCEPDVVIQKYKRYTNGVLEKAKSKREPQSPFPCSFHQAELFVTQWVPSPVDFAEIKLADTVRDIEEVAAQKTQLLKEHEDVTKALKQKNMCFDAEERKRFECTQAEYEQKHKLFCARQETLQAHRTRLYNDIKKLDEALKKACELASRVVNPIVE